MATLHLHDIRRQLLTANHDATPFFLALAWNAGVSAVLRGQAPARSWDYADRARNVFETTR